MVRRGLFRDSTYYGGYLMDIGTAKDFIEDLQEEIRRLIEENNELLKIIQGLKADNG